MIDNSYKEAYENLLKENTRLHAEKTHITNSAEKAIRRADDEIQKLHGIINKFLLETCEIVRENFPDATQVVQEICSLMPLRINASGEEKNASG